MLSSGSDAIPAPIGFAMKGALRARTPHRKPRKVEVGFLSSVATSSTMTSSTELIAACLAGENAASSS
eukprot:6720101-Lingulodinium_polyedra.AAC.1